MAVTDHISHWSLIFRILVNNSEASIPTGDDAIDDNDDDDDDNDLCCVCKSRYPPRKSHTAISIVNWAKCINCACMHWVHLSVIPSDMLGLMIFSIVLAVKQVNNK